MNEFMNEGSNDQLPKLSGQSKWDKAEEKDTRIILTPLWAQNMRHHSDWFGRSFSRETRAQLFHNPKGKVKSGSAEGAGIKHFSSIKKFPVGCGGSYL